jgi:hypothetical protein
LTDVDVPSGKRQLCGGSQAAIEKMLLFGRELQAINQRLKREYGKNESNNKSIQVRGIQMKYLELTVCYMQYICFQVT